MQQINIGKNIILNEDIKESYKTLKTNISFCGSYIKSIIVTSTAPNEGKTTVSFNLAKTLAHERKRVLFIDADLRNSSFNNNYEISSEVPLYGLSHYLVKQADMKSIIYQSNIHYLDIILSGPSSPNPTQILGDDALAYLIDTLYKTYDYIIIDTPPLGRVIDAAILANISDGAVLVIEKDKLSYKEVQNVKKQLDKTSCRILGAVLNKSDNKNKHYYSNIYE